MRLTRQTNYAFRALMYCAANDTTLSRVSTIAKAYGISEAFLFKIVVPLSDAGLLQTIRGRNGGVRLAKPASQITLLDVVRVTEDGFVMAECFETDDANCPLIDHCALNRALREALGAFMEVLLGYTIADLIQNRRDLIRLLDISPVDREPATLVD